MWGHLFLGCLQCVVDRYASGIHRSQRQCGCRQAHRTAGGQDHRQAATIAQAVKRAKQTRKQTVA